MGFVQGGSASTQGRLNASCVAGAALKWEGKEDCCSLANLLRQPQDRSAEMRQGLEVAARGGNSEQAD